MKKFASFSFALITAFGTSLGIAGAQSLLDPKPLAQQNFSEDSAAGGQSVDGHNWEFSVLGGFFDRNVLSSASIAQFTASYSAPLPYFESLGYQVDAGIGTFDEDFTSAAAGLHIFHRDPGVGLIGIYGDWGYVNPEHAGRVGAEGALYNDRWSLDVLVALQFGQHVFTEVVDEVDLSYYFTDNFRGSIGHRLTSRGNVGNVSFEALLTDQGFDGVSIFGEFEAGEDDYTAAWGGIRYATGTGASHSGTLIERDRQGSIQVRIPRNIASISQCGRLDTPIPADDFRSSIRILCADENDINSRSTAGIAKE